MAKKNKKASPEYGTTQDYRMAQDISDAGQAAVTAIPKPDVTPAPAVKPKQPVIKKRIRVRKKATKHLSVAVLCANPMTRRFI